MARQRFEKEPTPGRAFHFYGQHLATFGGYVGKFEAGRQIGSPSAGPFDKAIKENQRALPDGCLQLDAAKASDVAAGGA